jgi:putative transposase
VRVIQAYRFALEPTPAQERALRSHAGASRFAWNWGLARVRERYEAEGKWYSGIDLHKMWNAAKKADPALAWWSQNSKCAYQEAFNDLDRALRDFVTSKKGQRKGKRLGFPKAKKRGKCKDSFRFGTGAIRCAGTTVTLPRLGTIRTHESTRKLARRLASGSVRILSATVSRTAQRWFVSFTVEVERAAPERHLRPGSAVGVDLGVKTLLTGVDDQGGIIQVTGPKALRSVLRSLRRISRAHSRKARGGANRRKAAMRLAQIHARVANVRADALDKASTCLARRYQTVVVEDLNVTGMLTNRTLARAVADQGFGQARRMLSHKTKWNGGTLLVADRWYPSSKICSACGWRKPSLTLKERTFACEACGLVMNRDHNAARNLLALRVEVGTDPGTASGAGTGLGYGVNACGDHVRPGLAGQWPQPRARGRKQEPGTASVGQTGTAAGQPAAASRAPTRCLLTCHGTPDGISRIAAAICSRCEYLAWGQTAG